MAVGFLGDLIGHFIHPLGAYNWFMAVSYILMGLIPALIYKSKLNRLLKHNFFDCIFDSLLVRT